MWHKKAVRHFPLLKSYYRGPTRPLQPHHGVSAPLLLMFCMLRCHRNLRGMKKAHKRRSRTVHRPRYVRSLASQNYKQFFNPPKNPLIFCSFSLQIYEKKTTYATFTSCMLRFCRNFFHTRNALLISLIRPCKRP